MKNSLMAIWKDEVAPLLEELELREFRRNHIDAAENIDEIATRFDLLLDKYISHSDYTDPET